MKIFLISPVRNASLETQITVEIYVKLLEGEGHVVHWPARDTKQNDPTGGYEICRTNFQAMLEADGIHVWYDETSRGSIFDLGGVFMLIEMFKYDKHIFIVNKNQVVDTKEKSFFKVLKYIAD